VTSPDTLRVVRVIARLNVGGPSIQAITLTQRLTERGYATTLVRGTEAPSEGTMDDLAARLGVAPVRIPALGREIGPHDAVALARLMRLISRVRPHIVHTHAAKAGTLGRLAALLARSSPRPRLVHTFHGHVLEGYFSPRKERVFRDVERRLARRTDALVAVAPEVRDDLVRLGVAPAEAFRVVPLGFDLTPFVLDDAERAARRAAVRRGLGLGADEPVVTLVARLVPIKRVDRFLEAALRVEHPRARFVVVGDGELAGRLQGSDAARALGDRVIWAGMRRDMPDVCVASDLVVLTSDNEGTPVSLIEAQAAAVPVVSTRVGGVASVVDDGRTGWLVPREDVGALARAIDDALRLEDPALVGLAGRRLALARFGLDRLVDDVDALYRTLLRGA
jgi:glycosyltransferase involved in cell wall biosynthesis